MKPKKYSILSTISDPQRYDLMLESCYVLLRCDEWDFIETDENGIPSSSTSWIHSIQSALMMFGLDVTSYPQGSVSANRNYYEALRNYFDGKFPDNGDTNLLRERLRNFLRLRRDDSGTSNTDLYGSYFSTDKTHSSRDVTNFRKIETSLRHSAAALWILVEESLGNFRKDISDSLDSFFLHIKEYLSASDIWKRDKFKQLTISNTYNLCKSILKYSEDNKFRKNASSVILKCKKAIWSEDCLRQGDDGEYSWIYPQISKSKLAIYEYYLNSYCLAQMPELLNDKRAQSIVRGMLKNRINSLVGFGIPLHPLIIYNSQDNIKPDFGATASVLYFLWYSIENEVGGRKWIEYCKTNFDWVLQFCLKAYEKKEYYILPILENSSKILLMPRMKFDPIREEEINKYIEELKKNAIYPEMKTHEGKLHKSMKNIQSPTGLECVKEIIGTWNLTEHWGSQKRWKFNFKINSGKLGEFVGGILKAYSTP